MRSRPCACCAAVVVRECSRDVCRRLTFAAATVTCAAARWHMRQRLGRCFGRLLMSWHWWRDPLRCRWLLAGLVATLVLSSAPMLVLTIDRGCGGCGVGGDPFGCAWCLWGVLCGCGSLAGGHPQAGVAFARESAAAFAVSFGSAVVVPMAGSTVARVFVDVRVAGRGNLLLQLLSVLLMLLW